VVRPIGPEFVAMSTSVVPVGVTSTGGVPVSACRFGLAAVSAGVQSQVPSAPSTTPGVGAAGVGAGELVVGSAAAESVSSPPMPVTSRTTLTTSTTAAALTPISTLRRRLRASSARRSI
jgi:hypothetical protein